MYADAPNPTDLRRVAADFDPATPNYTGGYSKTGTDQLQDWDNAALPFRFAIPISHSLTRDQVITTNELRTASRDFLFDTSKSHELRVSSNGSGPVRCTAGLFRLDQSGSSGFFAFHPIVEPVQKRQGFPAQVWFVQDETARYTTEKGDTLRRNIVLTPLVPFRAAAHH
jgi:iron complex outermembrane recepter protein